MLRRNTVLGAINIVFFVCTKNKRKNSEEKHKQTNEPINKYEFVVIFCLAIVFFLHLAWVFFVTYGAFSKTSTGMQYQYLNICSTTIFLRNIYLLIAACCRCCQTHARSTFRHWCTNQRSMISVGVCVSSGSPTRKNTFRYIRRCDRK